VSDSESSELRALAETLGWSGLHRLTHDDSEIAATVCWYEAGDIEELLLQINVKPCHCAAVYAIPYGLCTGWHAIRGLGSPPCIGDEAARLDAWLHRRWFATAEGREAFQQQHPECVGYDQARIARGDLPYRLENVGRRQ
jgi:hypothetical protein